MLKKHFNHCLFSTCSIFCPTLLTVISFNPIKVDSHFLMVDAAQRQYPKRHQRIFLTINSETKST